MRNICIAIAAHAAAPHTISPTEVFRMRATIKPYKPCRSVMSLVPPWRTGVDEEILSR